VSAIAVASRTNGISRHVTDESFTPTMYFVPGRIVTPPCRCTIRFRHVRRPVAYFT
jgi:hypothetical protein